MEFSGYYFRSILKKTRRRFALQASEQALYEELVDICNQEGWSTSFQVSNRELTIALNCNEKSLTKWRQSLLNAGLISYTSGQSKRSFGTYALIFTETTTVNFTTNKGVNKGVNRGGNKGVNSADYNKLNKTKTINDGKKLPSLSKKDFEVRQKEFYEELIPFVGKYGKDMIREFYDFWRESNKSGTLMRYEQQKTWDLNLRLNRWNRNSFNFGKETQIEPTKKQMVI